MFLCGCQSEKLNIEQARYSVVERIAEGGFAEIDLVENEKGRLYACKRQLCSGEEEKQKVLQEIQYYRQFEHVNIVKCIGHSISEGGKRARSVRQQTVIGKSDVTVEICSLYPYYKRGSLQSVLELMKVANQNWSDFKVMTIFRGICAAIEMVHSQSPVLAHADLKPANILLTANDVPVLTDFGSMRPARIMVQDKRTARKVQDEAAQQCSMLYRAPELFEVASETLLDERVDIWSLGCVLYAMCYYESPFERAYARGDSLALATLNARITYPPSPVYSSRVTACIQHMLVSDSAQRPFINSVIERTDSTIKLLSKTPSTGEDVELFVRSEASSKSKRAGKVKSTPENPADENDRLTLTQDRPMVAESSEDGGAKSGAAVAEAE